MYLEHFSLLQEPFSIAPDPAFLFLSEAHNEALAHLLYGFSHGGFVLISGEVGTGKTTLLRNLLHRTPANLDVAFILNPRLTARELLETLCDELGVEYPDTPLDSVKQYIDALTRHLLKTHETGRSTVVIIDEAQILTPAVLEQIRLLTNLETNEKKLLRIILLGQPELVDMLNKTELRQLSQRVTARYHLTPLSREDTGHYISHRLARAGGNPSIFTSSAVKRLYKLTAGTPRLINILADRAMLGAYTQNSREVTPALINGAAKEVFGNTRSPRQWPLLWGGIGLAVLLCLGAWWWLQSTALPPAESLTQQTKEPSQQFSQADSRLLPGAQQKPGSHAALADAPVAAAQSALAGSAPEFRVTPLSETPRDASSSSPSSPSAAAGTAQPSSQPGASAAPEGAPLPVQRPAGPSFRTHRQAFRAVFAAWSADYAEDEGAIPCDFAPRVGLQCLSRSGGWSEVIQLNTPFVLELWDDQTAPFYGAVTRMRRDAEGRAFYALNVGAREYWVQPRDLRDNWFGAYVLLWQTPPNYFGSLRQGDAHPSVRWLRETLVQIMPELNIPTSSNSFTETLHRAVLAFQQQEDLLADGVVGPLTWIRLSDRLDLPAPKLAP